MFFLSFPCANMRFRDHWLLRPLCSEPESLEEFGGINRRIHKASFQIRKEPFYQGRGDGVDDHREGRGRGMPENLYSTELSTSWAKACSLWGGGPLPRREGVTYRNKQESDDCHLAQRVSYLIPRNRLRRSSEGRAQRVLLRHLHLWFSTRTDFDKGKVQTL